MLAVVEAGTEKSAAGCMAREGGKKNAAAAYAVCAPMEGERVNVVLCVYASVQGVRERRECDRQRENI